MQKFNGSLIRQFPSLVSGNAAAGIEVTVFTESNGLATLYAENSTAGAQLENPLTSDSIGFYSFYAENGNYRLSFAAPGFPDLAIQLNDLNDIQVILDAALAVAGRGLTIVKTSASEFSVNADDHEKMYICEWDDSLEGAQTLVTVGESFKDDEEKTGIIIIFTQVGRAELTFMPIEGVSIISTHATKAYCKGSTVALVSIDRYTWVFCGDTSIEPLTP